MTVIFCQFCQNPPWQCLVTASFGRIQQCGRVLPTTLLTPTHTSTTSSVMLVCNEFDQRVTHLRICQLTQQTVRHFVSHTITHYSVLASAMSQVFLLKSSYSLSYQMSVAPSAGHHSLCSHNEGHNKPGEPPHPLAHVPILSTSFLQKTWLTLSHVEIWGHWKKCCFPHLCSLMSLNLFFYP